MGKTYKDTPQRVKTKNEKFHAKWIHREFLIGRQYYRKAYVYDENGYLEYENYTYTSWNINSWTVNGEYYDYWTEVEKVGTQPKTTKVLYKSFKPYCTCGMEDEETVGQTLNINPCRKFLTRAVEKSWYAESYYIEYEGSRKKIKGTFKQMKKAYNTTLDGTILDDDVYSNVYAYKAPKEWVH